AAAGPALELMPLQIAGARQQREVHRGVGRLVVAIELVVAAHGVEGAALVARRAGLGADGSLQDADRHGDAAALDAGVGRRIGKEFGNGLPVPLREPYIRAQAAAMTVAD